MLKPVGNAKDRFSHEAAQIMVITFIHTFQVVKQSNDDQVTVIGCCVTLVEALRAYEKLAIDGVNIRVVDPFTLKPLDKETIMAAAKATGGRVITVEDHYEAGEYNSLFQVDILQKIDIIISSPELKAHW